MSAEGFKGHVATDGSLLGNAGKWAACGWAVVHLDYEEEMVPPAWDVWLNGGRIRGSAHHQEAGVDMPSCASSGKYVDPSKIHVDSKGTVDALRRGDKECI